MIRAQSAQGSQQLLTHQTCEHLGCTYQPVVPNPDPKSSNVSGWNEGMCLAILQREKR